MTRDARTPREWSALSEIPVVPGAPGSLSARYPGNLAFYDLFRVRRLHATVLVPKTITGFGASRPIPIRELARQGVRDGAFAFATANGFDLYRIENRRLSGYSMATHRPGDATEITPDHRGSSRLSARDLRHKRLVIRILLPVLAGIAASIGIVRALPRTPAVPAEPGDPAPVIASPEHVPSTGAALARACDLFHRLRAIDSGLALHRLSASGGAYHLVVASDRAPGNALPLISAVDLHGSSTRLVPRADGVIIEIDVPQPGELRTPPRAEPTCGDLAAPGPDHRTSPYRPPRLVGYSRSGRDCLEHWQLSGRDVGTAVSTLMTEDTIRSVLLDTADGRSWSLEIERVAPCPSAPAIRVEPVPAPPTLPTLPAPAVPPDTADRKNGYLLDETGRLFLWRRPEGFLELERAR